MKINVWRRRSGAASSKKKETRPPRAGQMLRNSVRAAGLSTAGMVALAGMAMGASASPADLFDLQTSSADSQGPDRPNVTTPGTPTEADPNDAAYFGTFPDTVSRGQELPNGDTEYLADPAAQNLNTPDAGGWSGYQEYSPNCFVRGATCVNWNFGHETDGGPTGDGDGFLRVNGTSLGVAPCTPNNGVGRLISPKFTYSTPNAQNWTISFDNRQTAVLFGEGHSTYNVQILDEDGRVVTTAHGPKATAPLNKWEHVETSFDGSKLVYGKVYRISIMVDVVHAETALSWGNLDFDNIKMTASPAEGDAPVTACTAGKDAAVSGIESLFAGRRDDLCPITNKLGRQAEPMLDAASEAMSTGPMSELLDRGSGAFAIVDLETGQFFGYMFGKESIPSSDPRNLLVYLRDGTAGEAGNFAILFAMDTVQSPMKMMSDPGAVIDGQMDNLNQLMADPGRLIRLPLDWQGNNLRFVLTTILEPMTSERTKPDTQLGGKVWSDANDNGKLDPGEPGVPGVDVDLTDANGRDYGSTTTGPDGRYLFTDLDPTSDPVSYFIQFDKASLPDGAAFTRQNAPGTVHANTSTPDPETGQTQRVTLHRTDQDLQWHAGVVGARISGPQPAQSVVASEDGDGFDLGNAVEIDGEPVNPDEPVVLDPNGGEVELAIQVSNNTAESISNVRSYSPAGAMDCDVKTLAVGESTTCTLTFQPKAGEQHVMTDSFGNTESGERVKVWVTLHYIGQALAGSGDAADAGSLGGGLPTPDGLPDGLSVAEVPALPALRGVPGR